MEYKILTHHVQQCIIQRSDTYNYIVIQKKNMKIILYNAQQQFTIFFINRNRQGVRWITPRRYEPNVKIFAFASCTNCSPYPLILVAFLIHAFTVCHNIEIFKSVQAQGNDNQNQDTQGNCSTWSSLPKTSSRETASSWLSYRPASERY